MKNFKYNLDDKGFISACGYMDFEHGIKESDPFTGFDIVDWQLVNNEWIYNPITMTPQSISKLQAVSNLLNLGRYEELLTILDSDETGEKRILFDAAHQFDRASNMVAEIATALGYDSEGMDTFFIDANKILV